MATNTLHFEYILPDVGGDDFAWGQMNNDNWIKADAQFKTINDRTISAGAGLTGGGNLSANRSFALTGQALALHNHTTNGILVRTGSAAYASRSIAGGSGITVTNGNGVSGNPNVAVDGTVLRTSGAQTATGHKTFTNDFSITVANSSYNANLWFTNNDGVNRATIYARPSRNLEAAVFDAAGEQTGSFTLTAEGVFSASGGFSGNGSALTGLNASNLASGTVADARLPNTAVRTSRTITAGDGLTGGGNLSANRSLAVDGTVARRNSDNTFSGTLTIGGSLNVHGNTMSVRSVEVGGNAHLWFRNPNHDNTALLWHSTGARTISLRTYAVGGGFRELTLRPDGVVVAPAYQGDGSRLTNLPAVGVGQEWVIPGRAGNTVYQNTTGRPIQISVVSGGYIQVSSNGSTWVNLGPTASPVIPPGWRYKTSSTASYWAELR